KTTIIDPNSNYTTANFSQDLGGTAQNPCASTGSSCSTSNLYPTELQAYQGSISSSHLLSTVIQCYNANYASCSGAAVTSPFTQIDSYAQLPNGSTRLSEVQYNTYGLLTDD